MITPEILDDEIEYLRNFINETRFNTLKNVVEQRTNYITLCVENIFHPQNASAIIRSAEAFGLQNIHVVESYTTFAPNVKIVKGSDKWVDINRYPSDTSSLELIDRMKKSGYKIVAATPHEVDYTPQTLDISHPFALFFGTEKQGISSELEENSDSFIKVPMYGFVESLNVSVCAAIMVQTLMERIRAEKSINWQLSNYQQKELLHRWLQYAVRDSENILKNYRNRSR